MEPNKQDPESMLPLTPAVLHILLALGGCERHGYSIMQEIAAQTEGKFHIGPTTLYRSIKRMLEQGIIVETGERPDPELDDERRRYYRLTQLGWYVMRAEIRRLERLIEIAHEEPSFGQLLGRPSYERG
ncbi:MAG: PadR family transcriptional regulator [Ktedonobacteraceae bacterium]|nr:PadR family transcriptional regulator [Ktedonobacteraceae bacterium]